ncbi:MAG: glycosyltransferase family 2 protein, partial [Nitrososphaeraceae archaeon]
MSQSKRILPARNEEKYIAKCLDSLLNQSYPNFEIVAINDSSSDRTDEI